MSLNEKSLFHKGASKDKIHKRDMDLLNGDETAYMESQFNMKECKVDVKTVKKNRLKKMIKSSAEIPIHEDEGAPNFS
jgi:hypothetical protein